MEHETKNIEVIYGENDTLFVYGEDRFLASAISSVRQNPDNGSVLVDLKSEMIQILWLDEHGKKYFLQEFDRFYRENILAKRLRECQAENERLIDQLPS